MKISRINKILNYRIFREFRWHSGLHDFGRFNVIYGWNGSGKTALSTLFSHIEEKKDIVGSEVAFKVVNGKQTHTIQGDSISASSELPSVRVFNRDFIASTLKSIGESKVSAIYFLGKENIKKQAEIMQRKKQLVAKEKEVVAFAKTSSSALGACEQFKRDAAKDIKDKLLGSAKHARYDKNDFEKAMRNLKSASSRPQPLSDEETARLSVHARMQRKDRIQEVPVSVLPVQAWQSTISALLKKEVVSRVIRSLADEPEIAQWVQKGLSLHSDAHETDVCRFCNNAFSAERRAELEAHFNLEFAKLQTEIAESIAEFEKQKTFLENLTVPDKSAFHSSMETEADSVTNKTDGIRQALIRECNNLIANLKRKQSAPFESLAIAGTSNLTHIANCFATAVVETNALIGQHNAVNADMQNQISKAYTTLEQNFVLQKESAYDTLVTKAKKAAASYTTAFDAAKKIEREIDDLESEILEHRRPADELNGELCAYLGHAELKFNVKGNGYALLRNGKPAHNLSEGERTAITFLYFLKSLHDKDFDLENGIVLIDDPVSSLDATALFSSVGYMKTMTKGCGQMFLFTHNFSFFSQLKEWLKQEKRKNGGKEVATYHFLQTNIAKGVRTTDIAAIDPLLLKFNSEYHFLFKKVHEVATTDSADIKLEQLYAMPNIARRLLETFFAYCSPAEKGSLAEKVENANCDPSAKVGVTDMLHAYSHARSIADAEHNLPLLGGIKKATEQVMVLMQSMDARHYDGMVKLVRYLEK